VSALFRFALFASHIKKILVLLSSDGPKIEGQKKTTPKGGCVMLYCEFNVQWDQLDGRIAAITINIEMPTAIVPVYNCVVTYICYCVIECITLAIECAQCTVIV